MAVKRTCTTCNGRGIVFDWFGAIFQLLSSNPSIQKRCPACGGKGYWYQPWRSYSPRFRRRGG